MQTDPIALRNYFAMLDHAADAAPTRDAAFKAGFHPQSTGGNCLVWERKLPCGDNLWLCTEDNGIDGELDDAAWIVGRHSLDCGFVQVYEPLPFNAAVQLVEQLPTPVRGGEHLQITYEGSLHESDQIVRDVRTDWELMLQARTASSATA